VGKQPGNRFDNPGDFQAFANHGEVFVDRCLQCSSAKRRFVGGSTVVTIHFSRFWHTLKCVKSIDLARPQTVALDNTGQECRCTAFVSAAFHKIPWQVTPANQLGSQVEGEQSLGTQKRKGFDAFQQHRKLTAVFTL